MRGALHEMVARARRGSDGQTISAAGGPRRPMPPPRASEPGGCHRMRRRRMPTAIVSATTLATRSCSRGNEGVERSVRSSRARKACWPGNEPSFAPTTPRRLRPAWRTSARPWPVARVVPVYTIAASSEPTIRTATMAVSVSHRRVTLSRDRGARTRVALISARTMHHACFCHAPRSFRHCELAALRCRIGRPAAAVRWACHGDHGRPLLARAGAPTCGPASRRTGRWSSLSP